jgi:predicted lipoprotein with Yx(FWY)xxD motif
MRCGKANAWILCVALGAADASAAPACQRDEILTAPNGMTLYVFDHDVPGSGTSRCYGACAEDWPPFEAAADAEPRMNFSIILREDGIRQWTYKERPLYLNDDDGRPGERNGDGAGNVWYAARP